MTYTKSQKALIASFCVSVFSLAIKMTGYFLTGSNMVLSDALESIVHILAVGFVVYGVSLSMKPADEKHLYGHERIEFLTVGIEGTVIVLAAVMILVEAVSHIVHGYVIQHITAGIIIMGTAGVMNTILGIYLIRTGRREKNMMVTSNGKHTLTDVWTTGGVAVTLFVISLTGWVLLDAIVSFGIAFYIMFVGSRLIRYAYDGIMDRKNQEVDEKIRDILDHSMPGHIRGYHNLRHRTTGNTSWIEFHLEFNGDIKLRNAHDDATLLERRIMDAIDGDAVVTIHLEPEETHEQAHKILKGANKNRPLNEFT